jgi:hypothetical protein
MRASPEWAIHMAPNTIHKLPALLIVGESEVSGESEISGSLTCYFKFVCDTY